MKLYSTLAIAAASLFMVACNLDKYPYDAIPYDDKSGEPLIQTANDIENFRWSNYAYFRGTLGGGYDISDDLMCEGFNATLNFGNNYGGVHRADQTFTSADEYVESFWASNYNAIRNYNILIAELKKNKDESLLEGIELIAGEAYFFRAYAYLRLARRFGKAYDSTTAGDDLCVPLVTVYNQQERPKRATVAQIYKQIKDDIDSAYVYLPETAVGKACSQTVTIDAVKALEANYQLDVKAYDEAYKLASELVESGTYTLAESENQFKANWFSDGVLSETSVTNPEALMMIPVSSKETPNGYSAAYTSYGKDQNSPTGYSYKAYYLPSQVLLDAYEVTDWRRRNWFDDCSSTPYAYGGQYHQGKFYVFCKYKGNVALSSTGNPDGHIAPVPYAISEMYLIAAEAAIKGGSTKSNALKYLKDLQTARKATAATAATLSLETIQKEWFKETVGEGKRIECIKRWGIGCPVRTAQKGAVETAVIQQGASYDTRALEAGDFHFVWPIPSYEIQVNPNLEHEQNPGYGVND